MHPPSTAVARFFQTYQLHNSSGDIPEIVSHFADTFLAAGPQGAKCVRATDFALALPKRKQLFESLGSQSTALVSLQETQIDPRYVLAKTSWQINFTRHGNTQNIVVDSTFLIDTGVDDFKILLYLPHQDIMQILKDRGILPAD
jgi:hypothetical protein